ncbi:MAG: UDP-N-acetylmuramate dehydrogenase [Candidatus Moranbacteria bacterium]|nr:UDP-N-acetylmuramate dehydrogenase [Candidatus Moranbacteria bacterium]
MLEIKKNVLMKNYTTFRIGGPAKFFAEVKSKEELLEALKYAKDNKLDFFILGGGSNLLVSDKGFSGIVIKIHDTSYMIHNTLIKCDAGIPLALVVNLATQNSLSGMEWAAGIPGTIGGAIRGNAGAFGGCVADVIDTVKALDTNNLQPVTYRKEDCQFKYKNSIFKQDPNLIIMSAIIKLQSGNKEESQRKIQEIIAKRSTRHPLDLGSAGSFFMNPVVASEELCKKFEEESGSCCEGRRIPAAWLVDQSGLKGKKIGGAMVSEKHTGFIVNTGNATAEDVIILVSLIKQQVRDKFGVELIEEVQYLGF